MGVPEILAEPNTPHRWQYLDIVPYHNAEIVVPAFVVGTLRIRRGMAAFPSKSRLAALRFADFAVFLSNRFYDSRLFDMIYRRKAF